MDAKEIETCIDTFGADVYRFCLKLCGGRPDADDLYQQTFLKALEAEWSLDWQRNPKALFLSLAYHLWKSGRRRQARRDRIAPAAPLDDDAGTDLPSGENIEEAYLQKERAAAVRRILNSLPEKFRVPLTLYYLSDCSVEQIAAILEKPPGTVKSRLFKGRTLIRKRLEETGYEA